MRIIERHHINDGTRGFDEYYGKGTLSVTVTNDRGRGVHVEIHAGEPEDATFFRDLEGAHHISDAIKIAYEAGKRGEPLEYEIINDNEAEAV